MRTDVLRAVAARVTRVSEPDNRTMRAAIGADPDDALPGNRYYRRVGATRRDLPEALRQKAAERSIEGLTINPLIARYATFMGRDWLRPHLFAPRAVDPKLNDELQRWWSDPRHQWQTFLPRMWRAKLATGEVALPAVVESSGSVVVDYWDSNDVTEVTFAPGSNRHIATVKYRAKQGGEQAHPVVRPYFPEAGQPVPPGMERILGRLMGRHPLRVAEDPNAHGLAGVLFFAFGNLPNAARGTGDYFASIDYLAILDDLHHAYAERAQAMARLFGHAQVKGSDDDVDRISGILRQLQAYASIPVTNESVTLNANAPTTGAGDSAEQERMIRVYGAAPMGIPPTILSGDFTEGNRAVAADASEPTALRGATQQDELAWVIWTMATYAMDAVYLLQPGRLAGVTDWTIEIDRPSLVKPTMDSAIAMLGALVQALDLALARKLIDLRTAREITVRALGDLAPGRLDVDEIERAILAEAGGSLDPQTRELFRQAGAEAEGAPLPEVA